MSTESYAERICREIREVTRYDLDVIVTAVCCELVSAGKQEEAWTTEEHKRVTNAVRAIMLAAKHYKYGSNNDPGAGMEDNSSKAYKAIEKIARETLDVEALERRDRDSLDFYDVPVWELKKALMAAYEAGEKAND